MKHRDRNRDPRRGLPNLAERRKTNITSAVDSKKAIELGLVTQDKHRFAIGQRVSMSLGAAFQGKSVAGEIVKLLPFEGSYYQYRVRSTDEAFERIANEHDLVAAPSAKDFLLRTKPGLRRSNGDAGGTADHLPRTPH